MKKMKTIKFPNMKEAYDIYDDEAVRSINGNKPDENGDVAVRVPTQCLFIDASAMVPGMIQSFWSAKAIIDAYRKETASIQFGLEVVDAATQKNGPTVAHTASDIEHVSDNAGNSDYQVTIWFGDNHAPIIVNGLTNTITLDPDWVAPAEVALKSEVEQLTEEKIDKGSPIAHQQLVTDIEGNTVWEEKLAYDAQCFEWDGNEEGREIYKGAMADSYVFISDVVPSITELNQRCVLTINKKGTETIETITGDDIVEAISGMTVVDTRVYILTEDGINAIRDGQMQSYWPFTKPGIWFMWDTAGNSWPSKFEYGNSKTIDPKYLPKAVAVADAAGDTPTAAEFNALLTALRNAGYLST